MGKSTPVTLGDEKFPTKEQVKARIRNIIASGQLMGYVEGVDKELCLQLFSHHPEAKEKLRGGVKNIQIRLDIYGKRYFHLIRNDGTDDDISWPKCLSAI
jgi:hypothetical protein